MFNKLEALEVPNHNHLSAFKCLSIKVGFHTEYNQKLVGLKGQTDQTFIINWTQILTLNNLVPKFPIDSIVGKRRPFHKYMAYWYLGMPTLSVLLEIIQHVWAHICEFNVWLS